MTGETANPEFPRRISLRQIVGHPIELEATDAERAAPPRAPGRQWPRL